jgi:hypothetical protein
MSAGIEGGTGRGQRCWFLSAFVLRLKDKSTKGMRTMLLIESKLRLEGGWRLEIDDPDEKTMVNIETSRA